MMWAHSHKRLPRAAPIRFSTHKGCAHRVHGTLLPLQLWSTSADKSRNHPTLRSRARAERKRESVSLSFTSNTRTASCTSSRELIQPRVYLQGAYLETMRYAAMNRSRYALLSHFCALVLALWRVVNTTQASSRLPVQQLSER